MVALEAAERGRAAIVTDVGGLPEIVADGETGVVVPGEDVAALARAIVALAGDEELVRAYGAAARRARARSVLGGGRRRRRRARVSRPAPQALDRGTGEQRQHEVERDPVARRAGEHPRGRRVVEQEDQRECRERSGDDEEPDDARARTSGSSTALPTTASTRLTTGRPRCASAAGCQSMRVACAASFTFSPG